MKKLNSFIYRFLIITVFCSFLILPKASLAASSPPSVNAEGFVLLDGTTGQILYSNNPDKQFEPASTTKVMTALLVLENAELDEKVTIGKKPPFAEGSSIGLKEGEIFTVEELLLGLLLESGNDCAEALAEHISGSSEKFAELMTKRALELGANNTTFKNPSGLHESGHLTTPHDLSLIMSEAIKKPDFLRISQILTKKLSASNLDGAERYVNNGNLILNKNSKYHYKYAISAKKGYTPEAKFTNVAAAKKDGQTLIAAILRDDNQYEGFKEIGYLFDYGFNNFTLAKVYEEGESVGSITLPNDEEVNLLIGRDIYYSVKKSEEKNIKSKISYDPPAINSSSLKRGENITKGKVSVNGKEIATVNLVSSKDWSYTTSEAVGNLLKYNKTAVIFSIVSIFIILLFIRKRNLKRKRQKIFRAKLAKARVPKKRL